MRTPFDIAKYDCKGFEPQQVKAVASWLAETAMGIGEDQEAEMITRDIRVGMAIDLLRRLENA